METEKMQASRGGQPKQLLCRGVRGATTVTADNADEILAATRELLQTMVLYNQIDVANIASIYFTTTVDLTTTYPAVAARQLGWYDLALMCSHEMAVADGLPHCIRVLIHWNSTKSAEEIAHVYLKEAKSLRPDRKNAPIIRPRQIDPIEAMVRALEMSL